MSTGRPAIISPVRTQLASAPKHGARHPPRFAPFRLSVHPRTAVSCCGPLISMGRKHSAVARMCGAARCLSNCGSSFKGPAVAHLCGTTCCLGNRTSAYMYIGIQLVEPREALRRTDATIGAVSSPSCNWSGHPLSLSHVHCSLRSDRFGLPLLHYRLSPPLAPDRLGSFSARTCRWRTRTFDFPRPDCLYLMCRLPLRLVP